MVASFAPLMPVLARAWPAVVTGGQTLAHAPAQVLVIGRSLSNRYRVRPWPSTRTRPSLVLCTATAAGFGDDFAVAAPALPEPPPVVAMTTAAAVAAATARRAMSRFMGSASFEEIDLWCNVVLRRVVDRFPSADAMNYTASYMAQHDES